MKKVTVGWFLPKSLEARAIWYSPERYAWTPESENLSGPFLRCPAVSAFSKYVYTLRSPFDIHLQCHVNEDGCELSVGKHSSITPEKIAALLQVQPKSDWREADKPVLQLMLNYYFVSDDNVTIQYLSPLSTYFYKPAMPGLVLQGRWNIHSWVRPVNFVFEWWNTSEDLVIRRGQPILNVMFLTSPPDADLILAEAEETKEVIEMSQQIRSINSYINNVFSILPNIKKRRPRKLVKLCKTSRK